MNPNPADNNQLNSQANNPQPQSENLPQLEKETPMDITLYPNNDSGNSPLEPEKFSNLPNTAEPTTPAVTFNSMENPSPVTNQELPPLPVKSAFEFGTEPKPEPITEILPTTLNSASVKETFFHNPTNQKLALIGGIVLGVLLVGGIVSLLLLNNKSSQNVATTKPAVSILTTQIVKTTPTTPAVTVLSLADYQLKIDSINTKYQTLLNNNPINVNAPNLNIDTVRYVGDEIFAITNEINELEISEDLKPYNQRLLLEFNILVSSYDEVVRTYKASSQLNPELKNKFLLNTKSSNEKIKASVLEIKNLK